MLKAFAWLCSCLCLCLYLCQCLYPTFFSLPPYSCTSFSALLCIVCLSNILFGFWRRLLIVPLAVATCKSLANDNFMFSLPSLSFQWRTGVNVLKKNSIRLAEVWMDDYSKYYYQRIGNDKGDYGDISDRLQLR